MGNITQERRTYKGSACIYCNRRKSTTLEEVSQLAQGRKIMATRKAQQEVLNYLRVLEDIEKYQEQDKITEKIILKLHRDITKDILENPEHEGKYREPLLPKKCPH